MKQYLDIVKNVLNNGQWKQNRTGTQATTTFCEIFRHQMSDGFPLLTTKKMYTQGVAVELEGFIQGITDKRWFQKRKCNIWNEWANPETVERDWIKRMKFLGMSGQRLQGTIKKQAEKATKDLGPIYGYQWRHFDQHYSTSDGGPKTFLDRISLDWAVNGVERGVDQLKNVVKTLKTNPDDRRMVVLAWNPNQLSQMALPPCHYAFTLVHINGVLNLSWKQRSCDMMLGVPFNIANYALLLLLLCKESGLVPGELVGVLEDCHIYETQIKSAIAQTSRKPYKLPTVTVGNDEPSGFDIFSWTHEDLFVHNYESHPKIDFGPVAI